MDKKKEKPIIVVFRMYAAHDKDLLTLYKNKHFHFQKTAKEMIRAYATGKPMLVNVPLKDEARTRMKPERDENGKIQKNQDGKESKIKTELGIETTKCRFRFDPKDPKDIPVIKMFQDVKPKCRNALIKSIIRQSVCGFVTYTLFRPGSDSLKLALELTQYATPMTASEKTNVEKHQNVPDPENHDAKAKESENTKAEPVLAEPIEMKDYEGGPIDTDSFFDDLDSLQEV